MQRTSKTGYLYYSFTFSTIVSVLFSGWQLLSDFLSKLFYNIALFLHFHFRVCRFRYTTGDYHTPRLVAKSVSGLLVHVKSDISFMLTPTLVAASYASSKRPVTRKSFMKKQLYGCFSTLKKGPIHFHFC